MYCTLHLVRLDAPEFLARRALDPWALPSPVGPNFPAGFSGPFSDFLEAISTKRMITEGGDAGGFYARVSKEQLLAFVDGLEGQSRFARMRSFVNELVDDGEWGLMGLEG